MAKFPWESITIRGITRGIHVQVGCKELVFTDTEKDVFLDDLGKLLFGCEEVSLALQKKYFPNEFGCGEVPPEDRVTLGRVHRNCRRCGRPVGRPYVKYDDTDYCECDQRTGLAVPTPVEHPVDPVY